MSLEPTGNFEVGDKVLITRKITHEENDRWSDCWVYQMDENVGCVGFVVEKGIRQSKVELYKYSSRNYYYPNYILKKLEVKE